MVVVPEMVYLATGVDISLVSISATLMTFSSCCKKVMAGPSIRTSHIGIQGRKEGD